MNGTPVAIPTLPGWRWLEIPPGPPATTTDISTGATTQAPWIIPFYTVLTGNTTPLWPTTRAYLQITQPDGIRYTRYFPGPINPSTSYRFFIHTGDTPAAWQDGNDLHIVIPWLILRTPAGLTINSDTAETWTNATNLQTRWLASPPGWQPD